MFCYKALVDAELEFDYNEHSYELFKGFESKNNSYEADKRKGTGMYLKSKTLRKITYKPDFVGDDFIIETKGIASPDFALRWKMFKSYLNDNNLKYDLYMPHNQKQVLECIKLILNKKEGK